MKALINWSEGYSVGIDEIDNQHMKLIELINRLYNLYLLKDEEEIQTIIKEIKQYAIYHFSTEEKLFREKKFKDSQNHIALHEQFIVEFNAMHSEYEKHPTVLIIRMLTFLQKWLTSHIMKEDKKYIASLN